ncbi:Protein FAR1-RELATED SEQUENCE [Arachis hypogaea]|nr:Protein FAR1-RELATED SEQUENCE [Arachis hypogaea]
MARKYRSRSGNLEVQTKGRQWTTQGNEIHRYALSVSLSYLPSDNTRGIERVLVGLCMLRDYFRMSGITAPNGFVKRSYEFSSNFDRVHALQDADDGMSGETVPIKEVEAMDSSIADADIDAEAAVRIVDGIGSFGAMEFSSLTAKNVLTTEFTSLQAAYDYYNEYGRIKGFSVRRSKVGRRTKQGAEGKIIWQIFLCLREGERDGKHMQREDRKMDPRPITRCGCEAWIKVHIDDASGQWFVEQFCDNHNHPMLDARFRGLLQSHRAVKEGGFETVEFEIKDIYNAIKKKFRLCLMGDLEVDKFERIWTDSVVDHGLEDHPWIAEMYAK